MKSNLHRRRLGRHVVTISMAWRAETTCGAFGFGRCGWNGQLSSVTNANGLVAEYAYDVMDRVTNIAWRTTAGASLGGFAYEYDAVGRIVARRHSLGDPSNPSQSSQKTYAYDIMDRLASDGGVEYTYDAAGNRMTKTENGETITYTLGVGDRLASYGRAASPLAADGGSYTYDAAGNVTQIVHDGRPTLDLVWNGQYQLVSVSTNGVFAEGYAYDALGRRVATTTREGTTRHVYDEGWQVVADVDGQGNVLASYVWGEGIDRLLAVKIGGESYYPLTDIQGTVWGYVDSQNNIVARWQYDVWGNVVDKEVSVPALATIRYRFQGREWSASTGLVNFRMRWYESETGRWLSKDPIGLSGGLNLYAFCGGNVVNRCDPTGTVAWFAPMVAGGVIGAAVGAVVSGVASLVGGGSFWKGAVSGAIGGAITGATFGLASEIGIGAGAGVWLGMASGAVSGGLGGMASGMADELLKADDTFDWQHVSNSAIAGAIGGAICGAVFGEFGPQIEALRYSPDPALNTWGLELIINGETTLISVDVIIFKNSFMECQ